jgi:iron complex outermembrane receptor protein
MLIAAALCTASLDAAAQAGAVATSLEEIIITARKRNESSIDVPMAVTAFTADDIQSAGIERPQDYIDLTPNMTMIQTQNQGTSFITVRGISQARNSEPSVAVLMDGVLMANPSQFNQELVDIESIEVLKGPQGALYGRNAIGGVVIVTTKQPTDEFESDLMAGFDSGPGFKARGTISGPLSEKWKYRVTGSAFDTDGYIDNPFLDEEADPFQDLTGRVSLLWEPSDSVSGDFRVYASQVDTQALYFNITESVNDTSLPVRVNNEGEDERNLSGASMKFDYDTGSGVFTSITAYDHIDELLTGDQFDFLPIPESVLFQFFGADQAQHQFLDVDAISQEIRFTSPPRTACAGSRARTRSRPTASSRPVTSSTSAPASRRSSTRRCRYSPRSSPSSRIRRTTSPGQCSRVSTTTSRTSWRGRWRCATTTTIARTRPRHRRSSSHCRSRASRSRARCANRAGTSCSPS